LNSVIETTLICDGKVKLKYRGRNKAKVGTNYMKRKKDIE
jgi:hypothetical protein